MIKVAKEIEDPSIAVKDVINDIKVKDIEVKNITFNIPVLDKQDEIKELSNDDSIAFKSPEPKQFKQNHKNIANSDTLSASIKLFYHISKMIESSLIENSHKYHADKELLKSIKRKKIILGHHKDE